MIGVTETPCLWKLSALGGAMLCMTLLAGVALARAAGGGLTPAQLSGLRSVGEVAISPDGGVIAYTLAVPRRPLAEEDGEAWEELHVIDADGRSRPYVSGEVNVSKIAWSPDGKQISYLAERQGDEHKSLHAIPLGGGESRLVHAAGSDVTAYSWSGDGKQVAVLAKAVQSDERKKLAEKGFDQKIVEEDWRPVQVWIVEASGGGTPRLLELEGSARDVFWSPAGDRLALKVSPTPLIDDGYMRTRIRVVDAESSKVLTRVDNPGKLGDVAWSPDGRHLAYISAADPNDPAAGRLMVTAADSGAARELMPLPEGHVAGLAWKDTEHLLFLADEGVVTRLGQVGLDGEASTVLAAGEPIIGELSLAAGGRLALAASTPRHPSEVFVLEPGATQADKLTDSNPWLSEVALAPQEVVTYEARDGLELQGLLIRPLEEKKGKRYPLVVIVHGGPEAHNRNGWLTNYSRPGQVLAGRGFASFYPNYRASTGRGVEFSKLDHGDAAGKEFDDLVDAVDHLIEAGLVDGERVGITGGSYGGYATAWGATHYSERFAAAVMFVGISNKISKFGTSDIPQELFQVHDREWPWENWQHFLERSPLYYVKKARTPILILHGEDDPRVFRGQSMELYRFLKVIGQTPVRLIFYPGEGHGNDRAASRFDYNLRMLRWMEHYLTGPGGEPPAPELDYEAAMNGAAED